MNPAALFKIKGAWQKFSNNHPRLVPFLNAANAKGITPDTIIEVKITYPDGQDLTTNVKIKQEDLDLFAQISEMTIPSVLGILASTTLTTPLRLFLISSLI